VATERCAWSAEESPDAIGWLPAGGSILVECKTALSDFYADRRKPSRLPGAAGMGRERWYLAAEGLLSGQRLPEGWGLLELRAGRVRRLTPAVYRGPDPRIMAAELPLLVAVGRRGGAAARGVYAGPVPDAVPPEWPEALVGGAT